MKIVVGLGNVGPQYELTRHNVGFMVLDQIRPDDSDWLTEGPYKWAQAPKRSCVLIKPLTFMNLSGQAVKAAIRRFNGSPEDLLVVHDDLDLPLGRVKIRKKGGSGGHKGVQSVIDLLGTNEFARIRIGIGRPQRGDVVDFVLGNFTDAELTIIQKALELAVKGVMLWCTQGIERAMNRINPVGIEDSFPERDEGRKEV